MAVGGEGQGRWCAERGGRRASGNRRRWGGGRPFGREGTRRHDGAVPRPVLLCRERAVGLNAQEVVDVLSVYALPAARGLVDEQLLGTGPAPAQRLQCRDGLGIGYGEPLAPAGPADGAQDGPPPPDP